MIGGMLQTVLLGLSWIACAIFASNNNDFSYDTRNHMQEMFQVTAPLLGIQVFVFHCVLHRDAARACKQWVRSHRSSANSSDTSSKVNDASTSTVVTNSQAVKAEDINHIDYHVVDSGSEKLLTRPAMSEIYHPTDAVEVTHV